MKTKEKLSKDSIGKIIIFEGLWNTGKTTLCQHLQKFYGFSFIKEPNHIKAKIQAKNRKDITNWYFKKHLQNLEKGFKFAKEGKNVVIERNPISSMAFAKAFFSKNLFLEEKVNKIKCVLKKYKNKPYLILLSHPNYSFLVHSLSRNKDLSIYSNLEFLEKFEKYLLSFCNLFEKSNFLVVMKLKSNKYLMENFQNIISKIL